MFNIVVNATAAKTSGALSILNDFINYASNETSNDYRFHVITCIKDLFYNTDNMKIYVVKKKNWIERIQWDKKGVEQWIDIQGIRVDLLISFQNTCARLKSEEKKDIPQLIYYHQAIPLVKYRWNPLKKEEFILFLYSKFYPYFVDKYNKNAIYIVQLNYIKQLFIKKFKNISEDRVHVIKPNANKIDSSKYSVLPELVNKFSMIYPATCMDYKNHKIIIYAVKALLEECEELKNKLVIYFTIGMHTKIYSLIKKLRLENNIKCIGTIKHDLLMSYYKSCKALLFPSKVESYGLPLLEATYFGLPIIVSDLQYAKEVLIGYNNKYFCEQDSVEKWKTMMEYIIYNGKLTKANLTVRNENSWKSFFCIVSDLLKS